jgi:hypothetical protein
MTRRGLLLSAGGLLLAGEEPAAPYRTPCKYGRLLLGPAADPAAFDSRSVDCPFLFRYRGRYFMTYVGWDGTGYQTGLASSANLIDWGREGCILRRDPASSVTRYNIAMNWIVRHNELRSPGELTKLQGHFVGVYHAYPNAGLEEGPAVIGLCRSTDLMHWDIEGPCLRPEDGAEWEAGGLYKPCLVENAGTFYLFYNAKTKSLPKAQGGGWIEQTGVATSTDLKKWTRYSGNPIIPVGAPGSPDDRFASDPCVLRDGKRWVFFYYSLDRKGKARDLLALGDDPFHPVKTGEILVDTGPPGSIDSTYAHKPGVVWRDGALYHFYCAVSGKWPNEVRGIAVARSRPW